MNAKDADLVRRAVADSIELHSGQVRRKSGLPYIVHPIEVMAIVKKYKESKNEAAILIASVGHDWKEDTNVDMDRVRAIYGDMATDLILELTNDEEAIERIGKEEYKKQEFLRLTNYALIIRLADNLANCSDSPAGKMMKRIGRCLQFLIANRPLTGTQQKIYRELYNLFEEYDMSLDGDLSD